MKNNDEMHVRGGGFNVGVSGSGVTSSVSVNISDKDKEEILHATIGVGEINNGSGMSQETARDLLALLNRDPEKFAELVKNQDDVLVATLDISNLIKLPENLKNIGNLLTALATPVPDNVKDMGAEAEKLFKRMLLSGVSPDKAIEIAQREDFAKTANHSQFLADKIKAGQQPTPLERIALAYF